MTLFRVLLFCAPAAGLIVDENEASAPAESGDRRGKRRRCHDAAEIARHLGDAGHEAEPLIGEILRHQFQQRGKNQRVAAGHDQSGDKHVKQVRCERKRRAADRGRGHAEQHHAFDAVAVDQEARRNLHQSVAPEIARSEHRDAGGVGAEIVHEAQADGLRRHTL
jgi:hypothetical protein